MNKHRLKCWTQFFDQVLSGTKRFEIRFNDRDYQVGDVLELHEYDPSIEEYTERVYSVVVIYKTDFKQQHGYVVMGIEPCTVIVQTETN